MLALSSLRWIGRWEMPRCPESTVDLNASRISKTSSSVLTMGSTEVDVIEKLFNRTRAVRTPASPKHRVNHRPAVRLRRR